MLAVASELGFLWMAEFRSDLMRERGGKKRLLFFNCSRDWNLRFVPCFVVSNLADASVAELADALDSKSKKLLGNECASQCKSEHDRQPRQT